MVFSAIILVIIEPIVVLSVVIIIVLQIGFGRFAEPAEAVEAQGRERRAEDSHKCPQASVFLLLSQLLAREDHATSLLAFKLALLSLGVFDMSFLF